MKVCVFGLWHLGTVTAACLASSGFEVVGLDPDSSNIGSLREGNPPLFEPGLSDLVQDGLKKKKLSFTTDISDALAEARVMWVTFDTPVDDNDNADVEFVIRQIAKTFPHLQDGTVVLISSQVPVGTTARLEQTFKNEFPKKQVMFAYSPENLRLGKAIEVFRNPGRVIVGIEDPEARKTLAALLQPLGAPVIWMSVASAEMTKHAINAFLGISVAFINEIATICEQVGADAQEVEQGLKSESRIGPKAYLRAGAAFAGGTLARDIAFLKSLAKEKGVSSHLLGSIQVSNEEHKSWLKNKISECYPDLSRIKAAVLGLTYKPGTDTLRRSTSVSFCQWLSEQGARVRAYDPKIKTLPSPLNSAIDLVGSEKEALIDADVLVIATEWEDFKSLAAGQVIDSMKRPLVLDQNRFLEKSLGNDARMEYVTVGKSL